MRGTRVIVGFLLLLCLFSVNLPAEVFFLHDGEVVLGDLITAGTGSVSIRTMGTERTIDAAKIIRTEPSLAVLKDTPLEVRLKDGTVMSGKLVDYDEEIGLFVDIGFGSIAIPVSAIDSIRDARRVADYAGESIMLGFTAGAFFPLADDYSLSWGANLLAEFRTPLLRGLYVGVGLSWERLSYEPSSDVSFDVLGLSAHCTYKFYGFTDALPKLSFLLPYAKLGAGAVLVQVEDSRLTATVSDRKEFAITAKVEAGIEWKLPNNFYVRTFGAASVIFQKSDIFIQPEAGLGLLYGL